MNVVLVHNLDIEIPITPYRSVSAETLVATVESLLGETGEKNFDGTRSWRLMWWADILNYTVFGEYFWLAFDSH